MRRALHRALLAWYERSGRTLPWRGTLDPYRIWVSEVMLQQTTVRAVIPYYQRFLDRFPDLASLAAASEDEVLAAWSGLGYYRRATSLLLGARHLVERGAAFPRTVTQALEVPGVGVYTAHAVLSIAHGLPLAVVDGNVRRVFSRLLELDGDPGAVDAAVRARAEWLLHRRRPGDWNQALMELGATVCRPRRPNCAACPVAAHCAAHASGREGAFPPRRRRRRPESVEMVAALVVRRGRCLLVRRAEGPLLARLWELPQSGLDGGRGRRGLQDALADGCGVRIVAGDCLARLRHAITHRRLAVEVRRARLEGRLPRDPERYRWVRPGEIDAIPASSLTRKILRRCAPALVARRRIPPRTAGRPQLE